MVFSPFRTKLSIYSVKLEWIPINYWALELLHQKQAQGWEEKKGMVLVMKQEMEQQTLCKAYCYTVLNWK